jgi:signal transduction histidine kinase
MQKFIEDLLRYSRITTSTHRFRKIKLAHVAREAISVFELELERLNMVVEIGDLPSLEADKAQMYQLFQNLFSNALKFRKKERPLKIKVSSMKLEDGQFEIQVEDNGIGFDEKYLDKIFRPFERLHGRSAYEGSGIGLALCQKIVQKHGGDLYAKSQVGKGAIFIITLPEFSSGNKDSQDATLAQA